MERRKYHHGNGYHRYPYFGTKTKAARGPDLTVPSPPLPARDDGHREHTEGIIILSAPRQRRRRRFPGRIVRGAADTSRVRFSSSAPGRAAAAVERRSFFKSRSASADERNMRPEF